MKKKKQKNKISVLFLIFIVIVIVYYFSPKEVKFKDVSFKEILKTYEVNSSDIPEDYTIESIPYELYFSVVNPSFKSVNCIAILSLNKDRESNKTKYMLGEIPKRTKLKYKIPFNMPLGTNTFRVDKNCTII